MSDNVDDPLRVDAAPVGPWARSERGPHGTRLVSVDPPEGATSPGPTVSVRAVAPRRIQMAEVIADGRLALGLGDGAAYSIRVPAMTVVHTRRPPGLDRVGGASLANAGLLHGEEGWRMVVLPSLGDVATDLGHGPLAVRPDGRAMAVAIDDGVEEFDLSTGETLARHEMATAAMAYAGDGSLVVAAGAAVARPGADPSDGSPVASIVCATTAWRAVASHLDGSLSVWDLQPEVPVRVADHPSPAPEAVSLTVSADGTLVGVGTPTAASCVAVLLEADSGAAVRRVEGARFIFPLPDGQLVVGGDWGLAFLRPTEENH